MKKLLLSLTLLVSLFGNTQTINSPTPDPILYFGDCPSGATCLGNGNEVQVKYPNGFKGSVTYKVLSIDFYTPDRVGLHTEGGFLTSEMKEVIKGLKSGIVFTFLVTVVSDSNGDGLVRHVGGAWYKELVPMMSFGQTADEYFDKAYNNVLDWQYQIDNYTIAIKINPEFGAAYYNRGIVYNELENYKDAIADFSSAIRINPDYAAVYNARGLTYGALENEKDAIADFSSAIRINPDYADAYYNRGIVYNALENEKDAIADFSSAIRINPDYAEAYNNRGTMYGALENYEDAIADFSSAIRINPDYADAYYNRGIVYNALENYEDAIADFSSAIRINPDYAEAYNNRGTMYGALENYKDAIADFSSVIRINPDDAEAYFNRGIAKKNSGLPYCSDYKKASDLGIEKAYELYYKQCK